MSFCLSSLFQLVDIFLYLFYNRKRMLEYEGSIEPITCLALSLVRVDEKGKTKKLKVVRSKKIKM